MPFRFLGRRDWAMTRDAEGNRDYKITHRVGFGLVTDGPAQALTTPGLPLPGAYWIIDNDVDIWATCRLDARVTPVIIGEPGRFFDIEQTFSTKQGTRSNRSCKDRQIDNPLLEPMKVSGSFVKYQSEATYDRFGKPILTSSWEQVRGKTVEFDANRPQIKIEQNVAVLGIEIFASMVDSVNDSPLWGLPPRTIKLSNVSWERKFYGQCNVYYTRNFEFDIRFESFDRVIMDEGTKVLNGHWDRPSHEWRLDNINGATPDPKNPTHFKRYQDIDGNMTRVILDGFGKPYVPSYPSGEQLVLSCSRCPKGMPKKFRLTGLYNYDDGTPVYLEYAGAGCTWTGTWNGPIDGLDVTLEYIPAAPLGVPIADGDQWELSIETYTEKWILKGKKWKCNAPNVLTNPEINLDKDLPTEITLNASSRPGQIYVQKYEEMNFLLLGLPLIF